MTDIFNFLFNRLKIASLRKTSLLSHLGKLNHSVFCYLYSVNTIVKFLNLDSNISSVVLIKLSSLIK